MKHLTALRDHSEVTGSTVGGVGYGLLQTLYKVSRSANTLAFKLHYLRHTDTLVSPSPSVRCGTGIWASED